MYVVAKLMMQMLVNASVILGTTATTTVPVPIHVVYPSRVGDA